MPYKIGERLPGEKASKLGHLEVVNSELVNKIIENFSSSEVPKDLTNGANWEKINFVEKPLSLIFAVDGSIQIIKSDTQPFKELAFIKTALIRLDQKALSELDQDSPHPLALKDIMTDSALYHSTVFPLKNVFISGLSNYNSVRQIIFQSISNDLEGEPLETLKWLSYQKWTGEQIKSPDFECPHCGKQTGGLGYDKESGKCPACDQEVLLTDMLGFHLEMLDDVTPQSVGSAYMLIHETLLLFSGIRHFWENKNFTILSKCLFIKDGPLSLRGQYVKLVDPIRNFFEYAKSKGVTIHMIGQEKSGTFYDHFQSIKRFVEKDSFKVLPNDYIRKEIQQRPERGEPFGSRTNYGNKIFVKVGENHELVLSIPAGYYKDSSHKEDLIGIDKILCTLNSILSYNHEGALLPIQLANGVASLSTYPSAKILKLFAGI